MLREALETNKTKEAQIIFTSFMLNPKVKGKNAEGFINSIISHCSNWDELETMEALKIYILPIVRKMNDKRIQRLLPKIAEEVDHYIASVESSEEKYQYARSFAWRNNYINNESGLDPLDYRTEEEYKKAVEEAAKSKNIFFFEESLVAGGIGESFGYELKKISKDYFYKIHGIKDTFVPHQTVGQAFAGLLLDDDGMIKIIKDYI